MSLESIKTKIAALLAKAEGTDNAFEAATFMVKVNELLEKHQIEMHEIRAMGGDRDPVGMQRGETNIYASMLWAREVAGALARYYGCRYVYWRRGNHFQYHVIGRDSARMTFELLLPFVISQVRQQAKVLEEMARGRLTRSVAERQIGHALVVRIYSLVPKVEERRAELIANALVPVTDLDAFMEEQFPDLKKGKAKTFSFTHQAADLAAKVSINVQATGVHTKRITA